MKKSDAFIRFLKRASMPFHLLDVTNVWCSTLEEMGGKVPVPSDAPQKPIFSIDSSGFVVGVLKRYGAIVLSSIVAYYYGFPNI